jgi:hypothetical protein
MQPSVSSGSHFTEIDLWSSTKVSVPLIAQNRRDDVKGVTYAKKNQGWSAGGSNAAMRHGGGSRQHRDL